MGIEAFSLAASLLKVKFLYESSDGSILAGKD